MDFTKSPKVRHSHSLVYDVVYVRMSVGGSDPEGRRKQRLFEIFGLWCDEVVDLIQATPEVDILRRDIYDKPPMFRWSKGHQLTTQHRIPLSAMCFYRSCSDHGRCSTRHATKSGPGWMHGY